MKLLIRKIRDAQGLTGEVLAEKAGISRSYLTEIETGTKVANTRRLDSIAYALGVRAKDLMEDPDTPFALGEFIEGFCSLSPDRQQIVANLIASLRADSSQAQQRTR